MYKLKICCGSEYERPNIYFIDLIHMILDSSMPDTIKDIVILWVDEDPISKQYGNWTWDLDSPASVEQARELLTYVRNKLIRMVEADNNVTRAILFDMARNGDRHDDADDDDNSGTDTDDDDDNSGADSSITY
jgi:hypothetical protein